MHRMLVARRRHIGVRKSDAEQSIEVGSNRFFLAGVDEHVSEGKRLRDILTIWVRLSATLITKDQIFRGRTTRVHLATVVGLRDRGSQGISSMFTRRMRCNAKKATAIHSTQEKNFFRSFERIDDPRETVE